MAILLKTASVRVSSIQIMQVRVQNKGKSVWKSRYDGDVSSTLVGPTGLPSSNSLFHYFLYFPENSPLIFSAFRKLLFLHKNNTMAILLKTAPVRVSSIQIMQVRVQNKGKSVWKSRYDGGVSLRHSVTPLHNSTKFHMQHQKPLESSIIHGK